MYVHVTDVLPSAGDWKEAVALIAATMILYIQNKRSEQKVKHEVKQVTRKTTNVEKTLTSNNGGSHIKDYLDRMESKQIEMFLEQRQQAKDISNIASSLTNVSTHINNVDTKLNEHIHETKGKS